MEDFRGDEISRRISRVYSLSAQISIIMDKDIKYNEWIEYQTFRSNIKIEVDNEIAAIEAEFYHGA